MAQALTCMGMLPRDSLLWWLCLGGIAEA